jgi:HK97 gp10 family phage protein
MAFKYKSFVDEVVKDLNKSEAKSRKEALKHAAKKMRKNISKRSVSTSGGFPGRRTGGLRKSIRFKFKTGKPGVSFVGSTAPHSHLLEFGHGDGKEQNKRPFVGKTLLEEEQEIIKILSTEYF